MGTRWDECAWVKLRNERSSECYFCVQQILHFPCTMLLFQTTHAYDLILIFASLFYVLPFHCNICTIALAQLFLNIYVTPELLSCWCTSFSFSFGIIIAARLIPLELPRHVMFDHATHFSMMSCLIPPWTFKSLANLKTFHHMCICTPYNYSRADFIRYVAQSTWTYPNRLRTRLQTLVNWIVHTPSTCDTFLLSTERALHYLYEWETVIFLNRGLTPSLIQAWSLVWYCY